MLTITENAAVHLSKLLADVPDEAVVRFVPAENGLSIELGAMQPGDTTFAHGDKTVLAFDAEVNEALAEKTLDLQSSEQGPQLTLR